jgi:NADH-quinone oxidoreductase subunit N
MAGIPPFAGFYGKFLVLLNLIEDIYLYNNISSYLFFIISIIFTLVIMFYYIRVISYIYASDEGENFTRFNIFE